MRSPAHSLVTGLLLLMIAAIALGAHREPDHAQTDVLNKTYSVESAPSIRVASFNMASARVGSISDIARALTTMDADIIALQEIDRKTRRSGNRDQPAELAKMTGLNVEFGRSIYYQGGEYGLAIASRHPISHTSTITLESDDREPRIVLVARVEVPGFEAPITVFNTHLDTGERPRLRIKQIHQLNKQAINSRGIKLLMGDINDVPDTRVHRELLRYWEDTWDYTVDSRSWPAANPEIKVDYIFTSRAQRWKIEQTIIPNTTGHWAGIDWRAVTDHLPVVVDMKLLEQ